MAFRKRLRELTEQLRPYWDVTYAPDTTPLALAPYIEAVRKIQQGLSKHYYIVAGQLFTNQGMAITQSRMNDDCEVHMVIYTGNVLLQPI